MWYQREISKKIQVLSTQFPIIVLTGARQVGKSSLLKKLFPHYHYIALDLPSDAALADQDPITFLKKYPAPLIIDEVQYAPGLFRVIKKIVDENKTKKGQYILTGSQKFSLMKGVQESLAGRAALLDLYPLSLAEISQGPKEVLPTFILRGGMPALYENKTITNQDYFRSYIGTYLERDVKDILSISSMRDFERFLRGCASRSANLLNKSDLARDIGVSSTTINDWISILQTSHQVYLLEPWFNNKSKSMIKSPKLYFFDTGLLCFLLNITSTDSLTQSPYLGAIWENYVFAEIYKYLSLRGEEKALHFWRDRNREIDFLINRANVLDLIEVKWTASPSEKDCERMQFFVGSPIAEKLKIKTCNVLGSGDHAYPLPHLKMHNSAKNTNIKIQFQVQTIGDLSFLD